jgi:hypothetical protein
MDIMREAGIASYFCERLEITSRVPTYGSPGAGPYHRVSSRA